MLTCCALGEAFYVTCNQEICNHFKDNEYNFSFYQINHLIKL